MYEVLRIVEKGWFGLTALSTITVLLDIRRYEPVRIVSCEPTVGFRIYGPMLSARIGLTPLVHLFGRLLLLSPNGQQRF